MIDKKLGFYSVGGKEFNSKISACIHATKIKGKVNWHFNDEIFANFDWTTEPIESLDELYDKRSKELREKYDYVIISYSGGADSHNIVESFLRQNLKIDELIINTMQKSTDSLIIVDKNNKTPENASSEHYLQTLPRLEEIKKRDPNIQITIYDLSDHLFKFWINAKDASWVDNKREGLNPLNATRFNYLYFDEIKRKFDKDRKTCIVFGIDKPMLVIHSDKCYVNFIDRVANIVGIDSYLHDYTNINVELFYWSPDCTKLISKQVHVIKRWLELNPLYQKFWIKENLSNKVYRLIHERLLRSVLYSSWNSGWFQSDKAQKDWYSEFDTWFINGVTQTKNYYIWKDGLKYVEKNASDYIRRDESGATDGLIRFHKYFYVSDFPVNRAL